jgi:hypothetical protein
MSDFLNALDREVAALERQLSEHPAYRKLAELRRVRSIYTGEEKTHQTLPITGSFQRRARAPSTGKRSEILQAILDFLREKSGPTKTADILAHVQQLGFEVGGANPSNTISSILSKSDEVDSKGWSVGWVLKDNDLTGGANKPDEGTPPVTIERQDDFLTEPPAQGREAVPGGGT